VSSVRTAENCPTVRRSETAAKERHGSTAEERDSIISVVALLPGTRIGIYEITAPAQVLDSLDHPNIATINTAVIA
jgi:hypothetical protein